MTTDPERRMAQNRARSARYRLAHPERVKAQEATRRESHAEDLKAQQAAYRAAHPERVKATKAAYRASHREEERAYRNAWAAAHPEKARERAAAWARENEERYRENARRGSAIRRGAVPCTHDLCQSVGVGILAWQVSDQRCYLCGVGLQRGPGMHMDHVIPIKRGGLDCVENVRPTCRSCNSAKRNRDARDFLARPA